MKNFIETLMKKNQLNTFTIITMLSIFIFPTEVLAGSTQFTVNGMVCAFCAQGIEKKLKAMPETAAVYINLDQKIVVVEAKKGAVLPVEKIVQEIKDAGYDVSKTENSQKAVADIRKDMEANHEK